MSSLIRIKDIEKRFREKTLFSELSLSVEQGDRIAVIGPNGAGKSTLLKIMAGQETADSGSLVLERGVRMSYVAQTAEFYTSLSVLDACIEAARSSGISEPDVMRVAHSALASMKFQDPELLVSSLSGGQKKRLQIAIGLSEEPDVLLLDEPTNHLDIESILELEKFLARAPFAWLVVSHDRWFLENAVSRIVEINSFFPKYMFSSDGNYSEYLEKRALVVNAEVKNKESLQNKVRTEQAWLRQGARARSTKSKKRTQDAYAMMENLQFVRSRQQEKKVQIEFTSSERKTKKLAEFFGVSKSFADTCILDKLDLKLVSGQALGILGKNGSGKSTFVSLLSGELEPDAGSIKRSDNLKVSVFRQFSESVAANTTLKDYLSPDSDSVMYQGRELHLVSWAKRFQFSFEQLYQSFSLLSGGEKARARISRLMLQTPDILILDEPTNDLDIETLGMLEESLMEFAGVVVLVSHDRFMINRVCNCFLGLDGIGGAKIYADYEQWERELLKPLKAIEVAKSADEKKQKAAPTKLSYKEQREFDSMEETLLIAEKEIKSLQAQLDSETEADALQELCRLLSDAQSRVDSLYLRWEELEAKNKKPNLLP